MMHPGFQAGQQPPLPPPEMKDAIDKMAAYVAKHGSNFEQVVKDKEAQNPKFAFLFGGPFHGYYRAMVQGAGGAPPPPMAPVPPPVPVAMPPQQAPPPTPKLGQEDAQALEDLLKGLSGSKDGIGAGKEWVVGHMEQAQAVVLKLRRFVLECKESLPPAKAFLKTLHVLYVLNDVYFSSKCTQEFKALSLQQLPCMLRAGKDSTQDEKGIAKVAKMAKLWKDRGVFAFNAEGLERLNSAVTSDAQLPRPPSPDSAPPPPSLPPHPAPAAPMPANQFPPQHPPGPMPPRPMAPQPQFLPMHMMIGMAGGGPRPPPAMSGPRPPMMSFGAQSHAPTAPPLLLNLAGQDLSTVPVGTMVQLVKQALNMKYPKYHPIDIKALPPASAMQIEPARLEVRFDDFYRGIERDKRDIERRKRGRDRSRSRSRERDYRRRGDSRDRDRDRDRDGYRSRDRDRDRDRGRGRERGDSRDRDVGYRDSYESRDQRREFGGRDMTGLGAPSSMPIAAGGAGAGGLGMPRPGDTSDDMFEKFRQAKSYTTGRR